MESWYILQGIPDTDSDITQLEYLLNFLVLSDECKFNKLKDLSYLSSDELSTFLLSQLQLINVNNLFTLMHPFIPT